MRQLDAAVEARLNAFAHALIDQERAQVLIAPERAEKGYWFGGGNMVRGPDGLIYLCGRHRSAGDSRTGLDLGDRGRELAIFASADRGRTWKKVLALSKESLISQGRAGKAAAPSGQIGAEVLSIEGAALRFGTEGVELFVSSEKRVPYPEGVREFMKPGTGVWSIERITASDISGLARSDPLTVLATVDPRWLHIKDPFLVALPGRRPLLGFCHHPYTWASSQTGFVELDGSGLPSTAPIFEAVPRGPAWDVAITRLTSVLPLPSLGALSGLSLALMFYDGGECLRDLGEHSASRHRPRGHSCEELGGLGYCLDGELSGMERLSRLGPAFLSPHGSASSRYVDVLETPEGWFATWQQSRPDGSQALVMHFLGREAGEGLLS